MTPTYHCFLSELVLETVLHLHTTARLDAKLVSIPPMPYHRPHPIYRFTPWSSLIHLRMHVILVSGMWLYANTCAL